ncbi:heparinase II/III domain-containing protein [Rhodospirillaceae bacterium SYSU D60014]|uniref:heparinase II/III family protein n=1 Tax=Virgifigura deserti TaxID=2268457 RepID=UPI000E662919
MSGQGSGQGSDPGTDQRTGGGRKSSIVRSPRLRGLFALPPGLALKRTFYDLKAPLYRSRLYRFTLRARPTGSVHSTGPDPWPGNAARGSALTQGVFTFAGHTIQEPAPFWLPTGASPQWLAALHGFTWLRDLRAVGGDAGRRTARNLVGQWIEDNSRWSPLVWRPDIIGQRLAAWLAQYEFYGPSADAAFRGRFLVSAGQQAGHLARVLPAGLTGAALLIAVKGLIYAGLALPRGEVWLTRGRQLLERELPRQILADGGHIERSPSLHLAVLRHLVDLRAAFSTAGRPQPAGLPIAIEGMAAMLRLFQHGDGGLPLFNDSNEEEGWQVEMALSRANAKPAEMMQAPQSGFQRLAANRAVLLVDSGAPPPPGFDTHAHAGTLSFEMSVGRERLIVNCGAHPGDGGWRLAQRSTAAHSTLVVADTNSSTILPEAGLARRPRSVTCRREEAEGNIWLDMSHDGYAESFGVIHRRRLFLAAAGDDVRGEDQLVAKGAAKGGSGGALPLAIRFHLHPQVQASVSQNGQTALLRLPSGTGWRMRAADHELSLAESIYLGQRGEIRRTQQIVIASTARDGSVKWALTREGR